MGLFTLTRVRPDPAPPVAPPADIWIVEDEPDAAELAVEVARVAGVPARAFRDPNEYLAALREDEASPRVIVLDWRLERELASALFLATRHLHPALPVIFWTATPAEELPAVLRDDPRTKIVPKIDGASVLEGALRWGMQIDGADGGENR